MLKKFQEWIKQFKEDMLVGDYHAATPDVEEKSEPIEHRRSAAAWKIKLLILAGFVVLILLFAYAVAGPSCDVRLQLEGKTPAYFKCLMGSW